MEPIRIVEVALVALAVGMALPVLWQFLGTVKTFRKAVELSAAQVDTTLTAIQVALERINRLAITLEEDDRVARLARGIDDLTAILSQVRDLSRVAAAVGAAAAPAVAAGIHAWRASSHPTARADEGPAPQGNSDPFDGLKSGVSRQDGS
jgi:hypothetical protein